MENNKGFAKKKKKKKKEKIFLNQRFELGLFGSIILLFQSEIFEVIYG